MNVIIIFNLNTRTHQWAVDVFDSGEWCFGVAVDAASEQDALTKIERLWDWYNSEIDYRYPT